MFAQINGNTNIFFQFDAIGYSKSPVLERMIIIKISISYDTYGSEKGLLMLGSKRHKKKFSFNSYEIFHDRTRKR